MAKRPLRIGLTGSIGMGKSETAKIFAAQGVPVHDSDAVVHRLYAQGGKAVAPVKRAFPGVVKDGAVNRHALSAALKKSKADFKKLEAIVHPLVAKARSAFLAQATRAGHAFVVLDIPLLFETGMAKKFDAIVVVSAPAHIQKRRVLKRPGMTQAKYRQILARQTPDAEKRAQADFVIETDKGLAHAAAQVKRVLKTLRTRAKKEL